MTLVITKTVVQEQYSALNATTWHQILSETKTWAILNSPEGANTLEEKHGVVNYVGEE